MTISFHSPCCRLFLWLAFLCSWHFEAIRQWWHFSPMFYWSLRTLIKRPSGSDTFPLRSFLPPLIFFFGNDIFSTLYNQQPEFSFPHLISICTPPLFALKSYTPHFNFYATSSFREPPHCWGNLYLLLILSEENDKYIS